MIVAGPIIAVVGSRIFRPLLSRLGLEGRLAGDNIARNPQRTATTSNALLIGVFFLKERLDLMKVLSTMTVLIGAALLRLARP